MEQDQINHKYQKIGDPSSGSTSSGNSFTFYFILFFVIIVGGIILFAKVGGELWAFGFCAVIMISVFVMHQTTTTSKYRQFFDNADNHTHDDNCETCGKLYGPTAITTDLYTKRVAYICRHASGKMDYPR